MGEGRRLQLRRKLALSPRLWARIWRSPTGATEPRCTAVGLERGLSGGSAASYEVGFFSALQLRRWLMRQAEEHADSEDAPVGVDDGAKVPLLAEAVRGEEESYMTTPVPVNEHQGP